MRRPVPSGYTGSQILLHWLIAALVVFQLAFGEAMTHAVVAEARGRTISAIQSLQATLHVWVGFAVLVAVLVRLALRLRHGAPPAPGDEPRLVQALGRLSHHLFYALLVLVPVTGIVAYYWVPALGEVHELGKPAFILLIAVHVLAALWHQFYRRDGLLLRMLRPDTRPTMARTVGGVPPAAG